MNKYYVVNWEANNNKAKGNFIRFTKKKAVKDARDMVLGEILTSSSGGFSVFFVNGNDEVAVVAFSEYVSKDEYGKIVLKRNKLAEGTKFKWDFSLESK